MKGWVSDPVARLCRGLEGLYYIATKKLQCPKCLTASRFTSPLVMMQLPRHILEVFPAILTKKSAIDKKVLTHLMEDMSKGIGHARTMTSLNAVYAKEYMIAHNSYLSFCHDKMSGKRRLGLEVPPPIQFSAFNDKRGWGGVLVSSMYNYIF
jgi:hypothetical protein